MDIKDKVILVTGSAKRVGKAIAEALAKEGVRIVLHYRKSKKEAEKTNRYLQSLGGDTLLVQADLSKASHVQRMVQTILRRWGNLHALINNASDYYETPWPNISEKDWRRLLDSNLKGPYLCAQAVWHCFKKQGFGKIVNITDTDVGRPYKGYIPYFAAKYGLIGLTHTLALEMAPIAQVNAIAPGAILLPERWGKSTKNSIIQATPMKRLGAPEDIARTVLFLLTGPDFITGAVIPVDGGRHLA